MRPKEVLLDPAGLGSRYWSLDIPCLGTEDLIENKLHCTGNGKCPVNPFPAYSLPHKAHKKLTKRRAKSNQRARNKPN